MQWSHNFKMKNTKSLPIRKNIRLKNYDYSLNGYYFVTICTNGTISLFGKIKNNKVILNNSAKLIEDWLFELENKFNVKIDYYSIMHNHIHFIIILNKSKEPLSKIIQWFKIMTTNHYIKGVKAGNFLPFQKKLWQRNYYEHIIRNEKSLYEIRQYIKNNPIDV